MGTQWLTGIAGGLPCLPHLLLLVVVVILLVLLLAALARAITYLLMRQLLGNDCCSAHDCEHTPAGTGPEAGPPESEGRAAPKPEAGTGEAGPADDGPSSGPESSS